MKKKALEVLKSTWLFCKEHGVNGTVLFLLEKLGQSVAYVVSYPFLKGAKLMDKL